MTAVVGHFALTAALAVSVLQFLYPLWGVYRRDQQALQLAAPAALASFVLVALAFVLLTTAFLQNDFSINYVAHQSNTALPLLYKVSAVWGGHEGSLLLWLLMLCGWSCAVALRSRHMPLDMSATVLAILGGIAAGFLLFILFTSNPFERLLPAALEGRDLNPLLQDPGLAIHPPMLYMGYVGFSVAFAFAVAALIHGRMDTAWLRWTRPWTTWSWAFLTLGIMLGSWWAYNELGWGGWWFWDPVENASFMPWLVGTALIHSLAATEKRKVLASWTLLLAISAFALSLLGTFLVRSGVLVSVHAFASDPSRGVFILGFFAAVVGGSLTLYLWRADKIISAARFSLSAREGLLLLNNIFLVVAAFSILLGTLYPLIVDAMGMAKPSVGPPWFNATFVPLTLPLLLLMGFSYSIQWWKADWRQTLLNGRAAAIGAITLGAALAVTTPDLRGWGAYGACMLAAWTVLTAVYELGLWAARRKRPPRSILGMCLAHIGVGVFAIGVSLVTQADLERDVALRPGESAEIGGLVWRFQGSRKVDGPNYVADRGQVDIETLSGEPVAQLFPEKRAYHSQPNNPMAESAVDIGWSRDLYAALGEPLGQGSWSLRLYRKPYIRWIWFGAILMALGGGLAATDRRYRLARSRQAEDGAIIAQGARA